MSVLIQRQAASGFADKGDRACSMGNLTRVSWETSLALVCGQLFALQSNVPSEMHDCLCTRDDQIQQESRQPQNSTVMWYLSFLIPAGNILLALFHKEVGSPGQLHSGTVNGVADRDLICCLRALQHWLEPGSTVKCGSYLSTYSTHTLLKHL